MKQLVVIASFAVAASSAFAQGMLNFANGAAGVNARITDIFGTPLAGTNYSADLYWAPGIVADSCALQPLNARDRTEGATGIR